jgi:hypothetical protein
MIWSFKCRSKNCSIFSMKPTQKPEWMNSSISLLVKVINPIINKKNSNLIFFTEFPESQPALEDLGICLQKTDLRSYLTTKLQSALETRLLHPGANTVDILITYVAAIRALRLLDPSGVLLDTVTTPVRQYLRQVS